MDWDEAQIDAAAESAWNDSNGGGGSEDAAWARVRDDARNLNAEMDEVSAPPPRTANDQTLINYYYFHCYHPLSRRRLLHSLH